MAARLFFAPPQMIFKIGHSNEVKSSRFGSSLARQIIIFHAFAPAHKRRECRYTPRPRRRQLLAFLTTRLHCKGRLLVIAFRCDDYDDGDDDDVKSGWPTL